jgi:NAD(P)-dependent dehydrogenase (short-subunit alcohol dehydrogenase family)
MSFNDDVVLVTGASRGIGRAVAQQFAGEGARVAVHYCRNRDAAEQTLSGLDGGPHAIFQADVADAAQTQALAHDVIAQMGRIHVLVNNAGIYEHHRIADVDYAGWQDAWDRTLRTNLLGPANLCYCVARHMIDAGGGRIVNVSSRGAFRGEPEAPAYGASKAGINSMSQSLAKALAPHNVFVTVVAPGWVETDMSTEHLAGPEGESIRGQSPMNRVARPDEIARAVVFLASSGVDYLTGCIIDANGASYLRT